MSTLSTSQLLGALNWRYATKKFDATRRIPADVWSALEQTLVLAPSSFGLQLWRFLVIEDPAVRAKFVPASWNQTQPVEASHFVVFARKHDPTDADVDRFMARLSEVQGTPVEKLAGYRGVVAQFRQRAQDEGWLNAWADRQVYIALGGFMTAAALLGVDTCPMEGLDPAAYDDILGLRAEGYATVVACAAGYRSPDDHTATRPKVRFPAEHVVVHR